MNIISDHAQGHGLPEDGRSLPQIVHSFLANSRANNLELAFAAIACVVAIPQILTGLVVLRLPPKITHFSVVKTRYLIHC